MAESVGVVVQILSLILTLIIFNESNIQNLKVLKLQNKRSDDLLTKQLDRDEERYLNEARPIIYTSQEEVHFKLKKDLFLSNVNIRTKEMYSNNEVDKYFLNTIFNDEIVDVENASSNLYLIVKYSTARKEEIVSILFPFYKYQMNLPIISNSEEFSEIFVDKLKKDKKSFYMNLDFPENLNTEELKLLVEEIYSQINILKFEENSLEYKLNKLQLTNIIGSNSKKLTELISLFADRSFCKTLIEYNNVRTLASFFTGTVEVKESNKIYLIKKIFPEKTLREKEEEFKKKWINIINAKEVIDIKDYINDISKLLNTEWDQLTTKEDIVSLFKVPYYLMMNNKLNLMDVYEPSIDTFLIKLKKENNKLEKNRKT